MSLFSDSKTVVHAGCSEVKQERQCARAHVSACGCVHAHACL
jgi:hypothetical protein